MEDMENRRGYEFHYRQAVQREEQRKLDRHPVDSLITIHKYRGIAREQEGIIFEHKVGLEGPMLCVRLFTAEGEKAQFRQFYLSALEAE